MLPSCEVLFIVVELHFLLSEHCIVMKSWNAWLALICNGASGREKTKGCKTLYQYKKCSSDMNLHAGTLDLSILYYVVGRCLTYWKYSVNNALGVKKHSSSWWMLTNVLQNE